MVVWSVDPNGTLVEDDFGRDWGTFLLDQANGVQALMSPASGSMPRFLSLPPRRPITLIVPWPPAALTPN
jgi:hypothetical protein